ncbi:MAG: ferrochelatase [Alphaproteobacteria bacterium]|nr:ferrochelatase [Alphaproteobacteria bacterium]
MESVKKIAVVLFSLGGPDSRQAIRPYLTNFFSDRNIVPLPGPLRRFVAGRIAARRSSCEAGKSYEALGYRSPLLENTQSQARALQEALKADQRRRYRTFVSMRYWHPRSDEVIREVASFGPDHIVFLPLYPQFSTTTTWSSIEEWQKEARRAGLGVPGSLVCCYPLLGGFIDASAGLIREALGRVQMETKQSPRLLLSAHGLPEYVVKGGDPYQWQCEMSAQAIVESLGLPDLDWRLCYQSRVGPMKWISPTTEEEIRSAGAEGKPVVIYPHAFVSEHVETLVEIEMEYRELAVQSGVPAFFRVPTVSVSGSFIDGLANIVREAQEQPGVFSAGGNRQCPSGFKRCCMNFPEMLA